LTIVSRSVVGALIHKAGIKHEREIIDPVSILADNLALSIAKNAVKITRKRGGKSVEPKDVIRAAKLRKIQKSPVVDQKAMFRILVLGGALISHPKVADKLADATYTLLHQKIMKAKGNARKLGRKQVTPYDIYEIFKEVK
jgi:histone H3/H4